MQALSERVLEVLRGRGALSLDTLRHELNVPMLKLSAAVMALRQAELVRPEGGRLALARPGTAGPVSHETPKFISVAIAAARAPDPPTRAPEASPLAREGDPVTTSKKVCADCKVPKLLAEFPRANRSPDLHARVCIECRAGPAAPQATPPPAESAAERTPRAVTPAPIDEEPKPGPREQLVILQFHDGARIGRPQISAAGLMQVGAFVDLSAAQLDELCDWWRAVKQAAA